MAIDGFLNLDKPKDKTSSQVVTAVRRISGWRRVGHGGTLDPSATGVLPICIGQATRLSRFLLDAHKTYRAQIEFGRATDTYDATGITTGVGDPSNLNEDHIIAALDSYRGFIEQVPPMYSAIKYKGKPLYRWARNGVQVQREPRVVEFSRLDILEWQLPVLELNIECSKGAYVRSLAHDLGKKLGCGAFLKDLVRLSCGPFHLNEGISLLQLEDAFNDGSWPDFMHAPDTVALHLPAINVDFVEEQAIINGRSVMLEATVEAGLCRSYSRDGQFVAILDYDKGAGLWKPDIVLARKGGAKAKR